MTPDLKTAARAALVEQIARICEPEGFYHGQWAVPSHRARGLAKAAAILAAIEPAIRADERERCIRALEPGEGTIGGQSVDFVMGRAYERSANIAAIRALKDKPS